MRVRDLEERDLETLKKWHRENGFDYPFPDLFAPEFERVSVVEDENGELVLTLPAKRTIEMYCLMNKSWRSPRWRLEALMLAHEEMRLALLGKGYTDVNCWLPPEVERSFGRKLTRIFKWIPSRWKSFSRMLKD